jgi:hypothetical protein
MNWVSPLYTAVIECIPVVKVELVNVARPPLREAMPRTVPPSLKVTVPLGVPMAGATADTVAVRLTGWPRTEGLADVARVIMVVFVDAELTVWVKGVDVLAAKFASPL